MQGKGKPYILNLVLFRTQKHIEKVALDHKSFEGSKDLTEVAVVMEDMRSPVYSIVSYGNGLEIDGKGSWRKDSNVF